MSARLLQYPLERNNLQDDLEAFVHTLSLIRLRFWPHGLSPKCRSSSLQVDVSFNGANECLAQHMFTVYDASGATGPEEPLKGGDIKACIFLSGRDSVKMPDCPLQVLLMRLHELFGGYYKAFYNKTHFDMLDDHKTVLGLFEDVLQSTEWPLAKTKDQFDGLCDAPGVTYKKSIDRETRTRSIPAFEVEPANHSTLIRSNADS